MDTKHSTCTCQGRSKLRLFSRTRYRGVKVAVTHAPMLRWPRKERVVRLLVPFARFDRARVGIEYLPYTYLLPSEDFQNLRSDTFGVHLTWTVGERLVPRTMYPTLCHLNRGSSEERGLCNGLSIRYVLLDVSCISDSHVVEITLLPALYFSSRQEPPPRRLVHPRQHITEPIGTLP